MSAPFYEVGRYACKVTKQALGEAKTGTPQFIMQFMVLGKVDPDDPSRFIPAPAQYERTFFRAITEGTIKYFLEDLKNLGFTGGSFKDLDPGSPNFQSLKGLGIDMWCNHEKGQDGNPREKWGVARQGGSMEVKPLEPKKLRDLDNLFGRELKKLQANGAAKPAPVQRPVTVQDPPDAEEPPHFEASDDDVGF